LGRGTEEGWGKKVRVESTKTEKNKGRGSGETRNPGDYGIFWERLTVKSRSFCRGNSCKNRGRKRGTGSVILRENESSGEDLGKI